MTSNNGVSVKTDADEVSFSASAESSLLHEAIQTAHQRLETYFSAASRAVENGEVTRSIQEVEHGGFRVTVTVTFTA